MLPSVDACPTAVNESGLEHRVYCPPRREGQFLPTLVMVHGRCGTKAVMWTFSHLVGDLRPLVVTPQAPLRDAEGGFSWWFVEGAPTEELRGDAIWAAAQRLAHFCDSLPRLYGADPKRVVAIGFSQGAVVVSSLALCEPGRFAAIGLLAGFIPKVVHASYTPSKGALPPTFISHGLHDKTVPFSAAEESCEFLKTLGGRVTFVADETGHKVGAQGMRELGRWLQASLKP